MTTVVDAESARAAGLCPICLTRPATDDCPKLGRRCRRCHVAGRLSYSCPCMTAQEAADEQRRNEMPKDKSAAAEVNGAAKTKPAKSSYEIGMVLDTMPKDAVERDEYEERLPVEASDQEVAIKARTLAEVEKQRSGWRKWWKAECARQREKKAYFEERIDELTEEVTGGKRFANAPVVDILLPTNEVLSVRRYTKVIIGIRPADTDDLQDTIPGTRGRSKGKGKGKTRDGASPSELKRPPRPSERAMPDITIPDGWTREQLLECIDREIRFRERVYPRQVELGKMSRRQAFDETLKMRAIRAVVSQLPSSPPPQTSLLDAKARAAGNDR